MYSHTTLHVKSHTTLPQGQVSMWCIVMSWKVSHHPSSRSSLNVMYCYVMKSLTPPFIKVKSQCDVLLCHEKSHTTLHQGQVSMWCIVVSCKVSHHPSSRSSLNRLPPFIISSLRILFVRNTEVLLPNFLWLPANGRLKPPTRFGLCDCWISPQWRYQVAGSCCSSKMEYHWDTWGCTPIEQHKHDKTDS